MNIFRVILNIKHQNGLLHVRFNVNQFSLSHPMKNK